MRVRVRIRVRDRVTDRVRVRVRIFSPLRHLHCAEYRKPVVAILKTTQCNNFDYNIHHWATSTKFSFLWQLNFIVAPCKI